jgi:type 1 glutamine amidotransferase
MMRFVCSSAMVLGLTCLLLPGRTSGQDKTADKYADKIAAALPDKAPAVPKQARKILIYSKTAGFRHSSIPVGARAIAMMGEKTGAYTTLHTEDESIFTPEKLKAFDAVFMLNTTGDCLRPKGGDAKEAKALEDMYKQSLADFVASGKGLIGVHSATDTYHGWKDYNMMMGGTFDEHPWHQKVPVKILQPDNVVNAGFNGKDFEITDEIYQFRVDTARPWDRKFLLCLDTNKMDVSAGRRFLLLKDAAMLKELKASEEQVKLINALCEAYRNHMVEEKKTKDELNNLKKQLDPKKGADGDVEKRRIEQVRLNIKATQLQLDGIQRGKVATRMTLTTTLTAEQSKRLADFMYPVSWISTFGKGRTFYCSLGHREEIFHNAMILKHYLAGIQYALGDLPADATPTARPAGGDSK